MSTVYQFRPWPHRSSSCSNSMVTIIPRSVVVSSSYALRHSCLKTSTGAQNVLETQFKLPALCSRSVYTFSRIYPLLILPLSCPHFPRQLRIAYIVVRTDDSLMSWYRLQRTLVSFIISCATDGGHVCVLSVLTLLLYTCHSVAGFV